jgi:broad specificity phosphatase PhoE
MASLPLSSAIRDSFEASEFLDASEEQDQNRTQAGLCCCRTAHLNSCLLLRNEEAEKYEPVVVAPGNAWYQSAAPSQRDMYKCPEKHGFYPPRHFNILGTPKNCRGEGKMVKAGGPEILVRIFFVNAGWSCRDALEDMTTVVMDTSAVMAKNDAWMYFDPPLADAAIQRAEFFGSHMKEKIRDFWGADKISAVFSSSEVRAIETALHTFEGEEVRPIPFISEPNQNPRSWQDQMKYVEKPFTKDGHESARDRVHVEAAQKLIKRVKFDVGPETQAEAGNSVGGINSHKNIFKKHDYEAFLHFMPAALEEVVVQWKKKGPPSKGSTEIAVVVVAGPQFIRRATEAPHIKKNQVFAKQYKFKWGASFARLEPTSLPSQPLCSEEDAFPEYPGSVTRLCPYDVERCASKDWRDEHIVRPDAWLRRYEEECKRIGQNAESRVTHDRLNQVPYLKIWEQASTPAQASGYTPLQVLNVGRGPDQRDVRVHNDQASPTLADWAQKVTSIMNGKGSSVMPTDEEVALDVRYVEGDEVFIWPRWSLKDTRKPKRNWYLGKITQVGVIPLDVEDKEIIVLVEYKDGGKTRKEWTLQNGVIAKESHAEVVTEFRSGAGVKVQRSSGAWEDATITEVQGEWVQVALRSGAGSKHLPIQDIKHLAPGHNPYHENDEVDCFSNSKNKWFRGQIHKVEGIFIWAMYQTDDDEFRGKDHAHYYSPQVRRAKGPHKFDDGYFKGVLEHLEQRRAEEAAKLTRQDLVSKGVTEDLIDSQTEILRRIQERTTREKAEKDALEKERLKQEREERRTKESIEAQGLPEGWHVTHDHEGKLLYVAPQHNLKQHVRPDIPAASAVASGGPEHASRGYTRLEESGDESVDESKHSVEGRNYKRFH